MTADPKQKSRDQKTQDDRLEEELEDSFPASDPPSMTQPKTHAGAPAGKKTPKDAAKQAKAVKEVEDGDEDEDEHDEDDSPRIDAQTDGSWLVDARASLEDLAEVIQIDFADMSGEEKVETLGGLVTTLAGRVLARGEKYEIPDYVRFDVLDADRRRLKRIRITLLSKPDSAKGE